MNIKMLSFGLVIGILLVVAIYGGIIIYITWPISSYSIEKSGVFGDSFGVLTSLFSGLAFAGIIITILLQREELKHQREELQLQRKEIAENRKELARTASSQEKSEEWFADQAKMMALSALANVIEIRRSVGQGMDRGLVEEIYRELSDKISK